MPKLIFNVEQRDPGHMVWSCASQGIELDLDEVQDLAVLLRALEGRVSMAELAGLLDSAYDAIDEGYVESVSILDRAHTDLRIDIELNK